MTLFMIYWAFFLYELFIAQKFFKVTILEKFVVYSLVNDTFVV